jgi:hypothetical protein
MTGRRSVQPGDTDRHHLHAFPVIATFEPDPPTICSAPLDFELSVYKSIYKNNTVETERQRTRMD